MINISSYLNINIWRYLNNLDINIWRYLNTLKMLIFRCWDIEKFSCHKFLAETWIWNIFKIKNICRYRSTLDTNLRYLSHSWFFRLQLKFTRFKDFRPSFTSCDGQGWGKEIFEYFGYKYLEILFGIPLRGNLFLNCLLPRLCYDLVPRELLRGMKLYFQHLTSHIYYLKLH